MVALAVVACLGGSQARVTLAIILRTAFLPRSTLLACWLLLFELGFAVRIFPFASSPLQAVIGPRLIHLLSHLGVYPRCLVAVGPHWCRPGWKLPSVTSLLRHLLFSYIALPYLSGPAGLVLSK